MKKRIVCVLLTLIMLVSLVPVTALTASAASLKTSEAAITIMKKLAIFKDKCYQVPAPMNSALVTVRSALRSIRRRIRTDKLRTALMQASTPSPRRRLTRLCAS